MIIGVDLIIYRFFRFFLFRIHLLIRIDILFRSQDSLIFRFNFLMLQMDFLLRDVHLQNIVFRKSLVTQQNVLFAFESTKENLLLFYILNI